MSDEVYDFQYFNTVKNASPKTTIIYGFKKLLSGVRLFVNLMNGTT